MICKEIESQIATHDKTKDLSLHQWTGLITEEYMEMVQAVNETEPDTYTGKTPGGIAQIKEEAVQCMALIFRMLRDYENTNNDK